MKKLLMSLLLIFCIGCTFTLLNETNRNISAKSTKETIMIDAGHGGYDVGAKRNYGDYEKNINLDIALLVGKQLKSYGFEPLITEVTRFLGTGFYRNLSYQAIPAVPAVLFIFS
ncbi:N-acetylmuramoyl-L-alanine amidase [Eubacterium sp. TM05-53]|uniref:N-acetylmuramoyl-L-alanine amidase family protein n=1 Tax=uncultured Holdemanella sp. TaxID=1763549 RepID=UPI000E422E4E|nr:N-acetylmuramoyl-L-alanine amidase [uncultured Holdemanella sp.]RGJ67112.1 N-acetylmuramoyl-L-alanine amidase [Eubacterium sp. TM05-53]